MDPASFIPLSSQPFLDPSGKPIANGVLFVMEAGSNNRAVLFEDSAGTRPFRQWPYRLDASGKASLWVPFGHRFDIRVFGPTGRLLLLEESGISGNYASPVLTRPGTTTAAAGNKQLTYVNGVIQQIDTYSDETRTALVNRKVLTYTGELLTQITTYDGNLNPIVVRTLTYQDGLLVSMDDVTS